MVEREDRLKCDEERSTWSSDLNDWYRGSCLQDDEITCRQNKKENRGLVSRVTDLREEKKTSNTQDRCDRMPIQFKNWARQTKWVVDLQQNYIIGQIFLTQVRITI